MDNQIENNYKGRNIGFVGLGKLGLPVATAIAMRGHHVMGYDIDPQRMTKEPQPYMEAGPWGKGDFNDFLAKADSLYFGSLEEVAAHSEIIFVAVQTPHQPEYEGITPLPDERVDFDYTYLVTAMEQLVQVVKPNTIIVVISTCLPGTMQKKILPLLPSYVEFCYNPFFIAMGSTMRDFLHPEFILMGVREVRTAIKMENFYRTITTAKAQVMGIESAELTKVLYNTFISFKISYANTIMELCHKIHGADVDEVTSALKRAHGRIVSPAYMDGGMGDGGGCHPRDNIAMSWLARETGLSFDLFSAIMTCRERQAKWLAELVYSEARKNNLGILIYGYAFKPNTNLTVGSAGLLVEYFLQDTSAYLGKFDPIVDTGGVLNPPDFPAVYLLGCKHDGVEKHIWPKGSVVIDPFRIVPKQDGVKIIGVGGVGE